MPGLRSLQLNDNQLSGPIPAALTSLPRLAFLWLHHNQLSGPIPAELASLAALRSLRLTGNPITGCIPPDLRSVYSHDLADLRLPNCPTPLLTCETAPAAARPARAPTLLADCNLLLAVRDALAGDATLNWDRATPITAWEGVTLGGRPTRVWGIDLEQRGLTGHIPPELGRLSALRSLYLSGNRLTGPIPLALGALRDLRFLWLRDNQLSGPVPAEFVALRDLRFLALDDNQFSGPFPAELASLHDLRLLWLSGNPGLTGCIPPSLREVISNDLGQLPLPNCPP